MKIPGQISAEINTPDNPAGIKIDHNRQPSHVRISGDLDRVAEIVRVGVYVNCAPGFAASPKLIAGASELLIQVFGEAGRHARTAIGVAGLPGNAAVEVDAIVRLGSY